MSFIDDIRAILELDSIQSALEIAPFLLLMVLIILGFRAISSHWFKEMEASYVNSFNKGKTEYIDPPRSNSPTFNELFHLALMATPNPQKRLVHTFSRVIKEQISITHVSSERQYSTNFKRLIEDPDLWLQEIYDHPTQIAGSRAKSTSEMLYENFLSILLELQEILGTPLVELV